MEQVESYLHTQTQALADVQLSLRKSEEKESAPSTVGAAPSANSADDNESARKQLSRLRGRSQALEELVTVYRSGVMALFPDGTSYGSAQFFTQRTGTGLFDLNSSVLFGVDSLAGTGNLSSTRAMRPGNANNVGWIEHEMTTVRKSYCEEIRLLEVEADDLRNKLRQSHSYTQELRKRFEDNLKSMYRPNKQSAPSEVFAEQFDYTISKLQVSYYNLISCFLFLSLSPDLSHTPYPTSFKKKYIWPISIMQDTEAEVQKLGADLTFERLQSRRRHSWLVDDLVKALQAKDAALQAVRRLENMCIEAGLNNIATYEVMEAEMDMEKEVSVDWVLR